MNKDSPIPTPGNNAELTSMILREVRTLVIDMRKDICDHLHTIADDVVTLKNHVESLKTSDKTLADQVSTITEWKNSNSIRIKSMSESDLEHQAKLAAEIVARETSMREHAEALKVEIGARESLARVVEATKSDVTAIKSETETQTTLIRETAQDVRKFVATPAVKIVGGILLGIIMHWLGSKGIHLN